MKKIIALCIIAAFIVPNPAGRITVHADTMPAFSLNLDNYNPNATEGTSKGIVNGASGSEVGIGVYGKMPLNSITYFDKTIKYVTVAGVNDALAMKGIKLTDSSIINQRSITFEAWTRRVKENPTSAPHLFLLTSKPDGNHHVQLQWYGPDTYLVPFQGASATMWNTQSYQKINEWEHIVFTRTYNDSYTQCSYALYINGSKINYASGTSGTAGYLPPTALHLGGGSYSTNAMYFGDISVFNIYASALLEQDVKNLYDNSKRDYINVPNSMNFLEVSKPSGNIATSAATIALTFDNYIDSETLSEITFEKTDGTPVKGKIAISMPDDLSKIVTVSYGTLDEDAEYILRIGADLSSINGIKLGGSIAYVYKAISDNVLLNIDFQDDRFEVGKAPPITDGLTYTSTLAENDNHNFIVRQTESDDKYITFDSDAIFKASILHFVLPENFSEGKLIVEAGVRAYMGDSESYGSSDRQYLRFFGTDNSFKSIGIFNSNGTLSNVGGNDLGNTFTSVGDSEGFHHMKTILTVQEDGQYCFDTYYDSSNPNEYCRNIEAGFKPEAMSKIRIAHMYPQTNDDLRTGVAITYIKISKYDPPFMISSNGDTLQATDDTLILYASADITEDNLSGAAAYLKNTSQTQTIPLSFCGINPEERAVLYKIDRYLTFGEQYTFYLSGAKSADNNSFSKTKTVNLTMPEYELRQTAIVYKNELNQTVNALHEANNITGCVTLENVSDGPRECIIFFQHFDSNGILKNVEKSDVLLEKGIDTFNMQVSDLPFETGDYVSAYTWEKASEGYKPITINGYRINY